MIGFQIDASKLVLPRSVAIVAFGVETSPWALRMLIDEGYVSAAAKVFDLRARLSDPLGSDRVRHGEDGSSEKTQLAVMSQPKFATVVEDICGAVFELIAEEEERLFIAVHCRTGFHRAWVASDSAASVINSLFGSHDGQKVFECQVYHLSSSTSKGDAISTLQHAWDWSSSDTAPWRHIPLTHELFGKAGCNRSRQASATIDRLENFVTEVQQWWDSQIAPGLPAPASSPEVEASPMESPVESPSEKAESIAESVDHPSRPSVKQPATITGDIARLQSRRQEKDKEAPHVMKAISDHD
jgi:hypothetical protein